VCAPRYHTREESITQSESSWRKLKGSDLRVAGRNVKDYLADFWAIFVVVIIVMAVVTGFRLGGVESSSIERILGIVGVYCWVGRVGSLVISLASAGMSTSA